VINVAFVTCMEICSAFEAEYAGYDRRADECICYDHVEKFSVSRRGDPDAVLCSPDNGGAGAP
jgi:hypothetical protein